MVLLWFPSFNTFIDAVHVKQYIYPSSCGCCCCFFVVIVNVSKNLLWCLSLLHTHTHIKWLESKLVHMKQILDIVHVYTSSNVFRMNAWIISVHFVHFTCLKHLSKILRRNFIQFDNNELIGLLYVQINCGHALELQWCLSVFLWVVNASK